MNKLYKVTLGIIEKGEEFSNNETFNVIAKDVITAIDKVNLEKGAYYEQVELIALIDKN